MAAKKSGEGNDIKVDFGYCETKITPPVGEEMGGYTGRNRISQGVHDDLFARAVSFKSGKHTMVLCSVDLIGVSRSQVLAIKQEIFKVARIPPENVLISAIHTHSGPRSINLFGPPVPSTPQMLDGIKESIHGCLQDSQPAEVYAGRVKIEDAGINRRDWDANSKVVDWHAEILRVDDITGTPLTLLYNFGTHCVDLPPENRLYSADWPYYANLLIKQRAGLSHDPIFFQGSAGNVNPVNQPFNVKATNTFDDAKLTGDRVGQKVAAGAKKLASLKAGPFRGKSQTIALAADDPEKLGDYIWATVEERGGNPAVLVDLQVLQLGDLVIFGVPGELFGELGVALKDAVAPRPAWVVNYANDYIGYLPTRKAFQAGGYEAMMMGLSESAGEDVVNALKSLAGAL